MLLIVIGDFTHGYIGHTLSIVNEKMLIEKRFKFQLEEE